MDPKETHIMKKGGGSKQSPEALQMSVERWLKNTGPAGNRNSYPRSRTGTI